MGVGDQDVFVYHMHYRLGQCFLQRLVPWLPQEDYGRLMSVVWNCLANPAARSMLHFDFECYVEFTEQEQKKDF